MGFISFGLSSFLLPPSPLLTRTCLSVFSIFISLSTSPEVRVFSKRLLNRILIILYFFVITQIIQNSHHYA